MYEVTKALDLTGLAQAYPGARKIAVDMPSRTAYVFIGRSNRAITVTGAEFDALAKMLPPAVERDQKDGETPADQKKRGKSEKAAE